MQALVITALTGPDSLQVQSVPDPILKPGQTLIKVTAGGLNFADFMTAKGGYPGTPPPPLVAGREFAGIELAANGESTGRRVMGYAQWAAFAEKTVAHSNLLWPTPAHWTDQQAAAFPVNYFTAYLAYWQSGMTGQEQKTGGAPGLAGFARPGSLRTPRVLIHAVAGGVGTAAVQIGQLLGVEMYGISSSEEKLSRVKALGLQHPINYKKHDYEEVVKNLTHGEGVDAVFDMLGGEHTAKSLRCLRDFGRVIQYGTATGRPPQLDLRAMYAKSAAVQGLWLTYLSQKPEIMQPAWQQLSAWIEQKKLTPQIGHVFPLAQAREAYKLLEAGQNYGKVILQIA
ncbi:MAG TPA: NADPH:quinone oxidoreductase family protein [Candidatus Sulfotelmatobacter sp.]|nr:NADPH:quinone oxidoreductase family protein [Candidatus Sulfotelmatobacter sp.]